MTLTSILQVFFKRKGILESCPARKLMSHSIELGPVIEHDSIKEECHKITGFHDPPLTLCSNLQPFVLISSEKPSNQMMGPKWKSGEKYSAIW